MSPFKDIMKHIKQILNELNIVYLLLAFESLTFDISLFNK